MSAPLLIAACVADWDPEPPDDVPQNQHVRKFFAPARVRAGVSVATREALQHVYSSPACYCGWSRGGDRLHDGVVERGVRARSVSRPRSTTGPRHDDVQRECDRRSLCGEGKGVPEQQRVHSLRLDQGHRAAAERFAPAHGQRRVLEVPSRSDVAGRHHLHARPGGDRSRDQPLQRACCRTWATTTRRSTRSTPAT